MIDSSDDGLRVSGTEPRDEGDHRRSETVVGGRIEWVRLSTTGGTLREFDVASDKETVAFLVDQMASAGLVLARAMFGEYGIYFDGRMVAMVCDDRLFVKPTLGGRAFAEPVEEAPPYPGAKPCLLIDADRLDDGEWLAELIRVTAAELPLPKPKKKRSPE